MRQGSIDQQKAMEAAWFPVKKSNKFQICFFFLKGSWEVGRGLKRSFFLGGEKIFLYF